MRCVSFTLANTPPHRPKLRAGCRARIFSSEVSVISSSTACTEAATSSRMPVRAIVSTLAFAGMKHAPDLAVVVDAIELTQLGGVDRFPERGETQHLAL